jgi:hypothetical protein
MILMPPTCFEGEQSSRNLTHDVDQETGGSNKVSEATHRIPLLNDRIRQMTTNRNGNIRQSMKE